MVDTLIFRRRLLLLALVLSGSVSAEVLPDPTRPPNVDANVAGADGATGVAAAPRLQSVILRAGARPRALINGEWLEQGQEYAGSKVLKITANAVQMAGPQGPETLRLTPQVELRSARAEKGGKERAAKKTGKPE